MLFSATIPTAIHHLIRKHLRDPLFLKTEVRVDKSLLKQVYYDLSSGEKFSVLVQLLNHVSGLSIIFCATRREVDMVTKNLLQQGIKAMPIHGGMTQNRRLKTVETLKREGTNVMVATDVAARGLDIKKVTHVFNYDVPKSSEDYVHRVGRTARIGGSGEAITLLTPRDHENFRKVLEDPTLKIEKGIPPQYERLRFQRQEQRDSQYQRGPRQGGHQFRSHQAPREQFGRHAHRQGHKPKFLGA